MKYLSLNNDEQLQIVNARRVELERQHFNTQLSLKMAEEKMAANLHGADVEVLELSQMLSRIETSLSCLGKLYS